jgi:hypothetical protein
MLRNHQKQELTLLKYMRQAQQRLVMLPLHLRYHMIQFSTYPTLSIRRRTLFQHHSRLRIPVCPSSRSRGRPRRSPNSSPPTNRRMRSSPFQLPRKGIAQAHLDTLLPTDDARRDHSVCRAHGTHAAIEHDRCGPWRRGFQDVYVCV